MDKNLQNIEDLFKKGLEGHEDTPSEKVWNAIDQSLDRTSSLRIRKKYYTLKWATAFLAVGLAAMSIYLFRNLSEKSLTGSNKNGTVLSAKLWSKTPRENRLTPPAAVKKTRQSGSDLERPAVSSTQQENGNAADKNSAMKTAVKENRRKAASGNHSERQLDGGSTASKDLSQMEKTERHQNNGIRRSGHDEPLESSPMDIKSSPRETRVSTTTKMEPIRSVDSKSLALMEANLLKGISTLSPFAKPLSIKSHLIHLRRTHVVDLTAFYSPDLPFSHLRDEDNSFGNPYSRELEKKEKPTYSYSFGVAMAYHLNRNWALETGIGFSTININMEPEKIFAQRDNQGAVKFQINTSAGKGYVVPSFSTHPQIGDSLFTRNGSHSLRYTSIPVGAKYNFSYKRLDVNLVAGFSMNILCREKISTDVNRGNESEHENIREIHGPRSVYLSSITGAGVDYNIYRNFSLTFSPLINIALQPINRDVPVNSYPRKLDFRIGLKTVL